MSPEQAEGRPVGPASDVFSLGSVLAFASTGEGPFGSGTPTAQLYRVVYGMPHLDQLPGPVRPLVERCLAKDPAQRPTAGQFLDELTAAHPAAADLTDWLPAWVLPAASARPPAKDAAKDPVPRPAAAAPEPPAEVTGPVAVVTGAAETPTGQPAPADPPAASDPPTPDGAWQPTMTAVADHRAAGSAGPAEPPAAGSVQPMPAGGTNGELPAAAVQARTGNRRRRWTVSAVAAVVVLGAIGLIIAAPWKPPPPVLRPTGLIANSATVNSAAFRWSGPATGPAPDTYEIMRNGQSVGSVPGNITYYQAAGLAPDTSYQFRVIAIRDDKRSPQSMALGITTLTPPVSAAVLYGYWIASYTTTSVSYHETWNIAKVGAKWTDNWAFTTNCPVGACNVTLNGTFNGFNFTAPLSRAGSTYTGTAPLDDYNYCGSSSNYIDDTLHFQIQVQGAEVRGTTWTASSFSGTVTLDSPYDPNGDCNAVTIKANVLGAG
jgi:hypothetical protein